MATTSTFKKELITMLNEALKLEHAARIQYLSHAETIKGINAEPIIARLKEIASDEKNHEDKFRKMLSFLDGVPTMDLAKTHEAKGIEPILKINLKTEKEAIDFYEQIYQKICAHKGELQYLYETLEHELRHVILDEQEHVQELEVLLGE
jgi:bacterioferritin (cytochrome b1)